MPPTDRPREFPGSEPPVKLIAIMTCHNRREHTLACLDSLFAARDERLASTEAVLVDDASSDGTGQAVRARFAGRVLVVDGDGALYWSRGTHRGFEMARRRGADLYLWLNDDTVLAPDAMTRLLDACRAAQRIVSDGAVIVVGAVVDRSGTLTYGGQVASGRRWRPLDFRPVWHASELRECDVMNGNCVLIPNAVACRVGNLDPAFEHAMGDTDYALRARALGVRIFVAPGTVGWCERNGVAGTYLDGALPRRARWAAILGRKGLPWRSWLRFTRRHAGWLWPVYFAKPYLKALLSRPRS